MRHNIKLNNIVIITDVDSLQCEIVMDNPQQKLYVNSPSVYKSKPRSVQSEVEDESQGEHRT